MKLFTGIAKLFVRNPRPKLPFKLWNELLWLAHEYPANEQFRFKAIIAASMYGITEEQLILAGIVEAKPPKRLTSDEIAAGVRNEERK
jgi:hypothetical protein